MFCPHCNTELTIPECVIGNINVYNSTPVIAATCCGKGIRISATRTYHTSVAHGPDREDD